MGVRKELCDGHGWLCIVPAGKFRLFKRCENVKADKSLGIIYRDLKTGKFDPVDAPNDLIHERVLFYPSCVYTDEILISSI